MLADARGLPLPSASVWTVSIAANWGRVRESFSQETWSLEPAIVAFPERMATRLKAGAFSLRGMACVEGGEVVGVVSRPVGEPAAGGNGQRSVADAAAVSKTSASQ